MADLEQQVVDALKKVVDPHTGVSVYDMGLVTDLRIEGGTVNLTFIPTSPVCPMGFQLAKDIKDNVTKVEGIDDCKVNIVGHIMAEQFNKQLNS